MIERESLGEWVAAACGLDAVAFEPGLGQEWEAEIPSDALPCAIEALRRLPEWRHLSTITGLATSDVGELLYHCWLGQGVTLRVTVPGQRAEMPTLVTQLPGASWYEREVQEMLGITFVGLPVAPRLLLNDNWDGPPPLSGGEEQA